MAQMIVERFSRKGVVGQPYDSSLQRTKGFRVYGNNTAVAAKQIVEIKTNPAADDNATLTVGGVNYKFVASGTGADEVVIGASATATATNLAEKVNANALVEAAASGARVTITAKVVGADGNSIPCFTNTPAKITVIGGNFLYGGCDANMTAIVGRVYTYDASDANKVVMGQTGAVAGILKGPYQLANYNNLKDNLGVANGTIGEIMRFGTAWVRVTTDVTPAHKVVYNNTDGSLSGVTGDAPTGNTVLANARYLGSAQAGDIVGVELSY